MPDNALPDWVKPGVSFQERYGADNPNNTLWHVRGIVDDMAACRRWRPHKQRWHYEVLDWIWFDVMEKRLRPRGQRK